MLPDNVKKYKRDIEKTLRYHNLAHLIERLENEEHMRDELNKVFSNMASDKIPVELDWLYAQYNVLRVKSKKEA